MLPIVWFLVVALLAYAVYFLWAWIPYIVGVGVALVALGWVVVSTLWPSKPDRRCPRCGGEGLVKIERGKPGVRCELCDFRDEDLHVSYLDDW